MQIIPIKDLKDTNKICNFVQNSSEPVFITKNGYGSMVIMNLETYQRTCAANYVREKLSEAEAEFEAGAKGSDAKTVFSKLRKKYEY